MPIGNSNGYTKLICQAIGAHFMIPNTGVMHACT